MIEEILRCPQTQQSVTVDWEKSRVTTSDEQISYPIVDGIIDFVLDNQSVSKSYDDISPYYDTFLTSSTILSRLYNKIVWGMNDLEYVKKVLSFVPNRQNQILLDVPIGSGVFTSKLYANLDKNSTIIACDYSMGMLRNAKKRYEKQGVSNVVFLRCDVGQLPIVSDGIDVVVTMNGFHAFPDKNKALKEMARVMKPQREIVGCYYIKNKRLLTDAVIKTLYSWQGSFTPPFYSIDEIKSIWGRYFDFKTIDHVKSILYFEGVKRGDP
jgi:ubiquinone/menaquinone biosynthesis C-methylase UbiE